MASTSTRDPLSGSAECPPVPCRSPPPEPDNLGLCITNYPPNAPIPHPTASREVARRFLHEFVAHHNSIFPDDPYPTKFAARWKNHAEPLYAESDEKLQRRFGDIPGSLLYQRLSISKYGWVKIKPARIQSCGYCLLRDLQRTRQRTLRTAFLAGSITPVCPTHLPVPIRCRATMGILQVLELAHW